MSDVQPESWETQLGGARSAGGTNYDQLINMIDVMAGTTAGYFAKLRAAGIPEDIAGQMAKDFHDVMIEQVKGDQKKTQGPQYPLPGKGRR